jgi:hypothetical protein
MRCFLHLTASERVVPDTGNTVSSHQHMTRPINALFDVDAK